MLDPAERLLKRDDIVVPLTHRVFELLLALVRSHGRLLTKDEIMHAVWPGRIVDEGSLTQAIFMLRKALGSANEEGRYIVTVPGRGYRFNAPAEIAPDSTIAAREVPFPASTSSPETAATAREAKSPRIAMRYVAGFSMLAILAAAAAIFAWHRSGVLRTGKPTVVVLSDFQNLTDDPALGTVLDKMLEIDLAQSPFLSLISPQQIAETLRLMERPADSPLTPKLALDVCARNQGSDVLSGGVAAVGERFVVMLQATDCNSGKSIFESKAEVDRKEDLMHALDGVTARLRESLNESSASIRKFGVPNAQATTTSFEALRAFSLGEQARAAGDNAAAIPLLKHALDLDPSFAIAYEELASAYLGQSEPEMAKTNYRKAFDLRNKVSEIENLRITSHYDQFIGNVPEAIRAYRVWAQIYPQDWVPQSNLANLYTDIADYPDAIEAGKEALRLNPEHANPYVVLARAYKRSTRFADAKAICRQAISKKLDGLSVHSLLFEIAFAQHDPAMMAEQIAKEKDSPGMSDMLDYKAWAAATEGKVRQANALFAQAIDAARLHGSDHEEQVSEYFTDNIAMLADFNMNDQAARLISKATGIDGNDDAPFALARAGEIERASRLSSAFGSRYPDSTMVDKVFVPMIQAAIYVKQRRPQDAVRILQPALPYELRDFDMPSLLGQAYLTMNEPGKAAAEFKKILANHGVDGISPLYPLAQLGLARAYRAEHNIVASKEAYKLFFSDWKDADPDLPLLRDAKAEYTML
jgi:DNA-binding winged helix-turn-helix (wHTH) protein/Tfp pilus assembly protein PilF